LYVDPTAALGDVREMLPLADASAFTPTLAAMAFLDRPKLTPTDALTM
jgi:hypothetical protein